MGCFFKKKNTAFVFCYLQDNSIIFVCYNPIILFFYFSKVSNGKQTICTVNSFHFLGVKVVVGNNSPDIVWSLAKYFVLK